MHLIPKNTHPRHINTSHNPQSSRCQSAWLFGEELRNEYSIDVLDAIESGMLELHYSEFGIGGGANYAGDQVARSPSEVALRPFFGCARVQSLACTTYMPYACRGATVPRPLPSSCTPPPGQDLWTVQT